MNIVMMIGRLTKDPELRYVGDGVAVTNFLIAVDRSFAKKDAEITADFFNISIWGKRAENCANYLSKGKMIALKGRIQNNNYMDKSGNKQYGIEIIADEIKFIDKLDKKSDEKEILKNDITNQVNEN